MTLPPATLERLRFLARVAEKEARHLALTDARLFSVAFTPDRVGELEESPELAERVDALQIAHEFVPALTGVANRLRGEIAERGWSTAV